MAGRQLPSKVERLQQELERSGILGLRKKLGKQLAGVDQKTAGELWKKSWGLVGTNVLGFLMI